MEQKFMSVKEFREGGYLQELNRRFLHPLGLAMSVFVDEDGNETFGNIIDCRDEEEGIIFGEDVTSTKRFEDNAKKIAGEWVERYLPRAEKYGSMIQVKVEDNEEIV